jgi:hypothetical protein
MQVDDCRKTYAELSAKGVEFVPEPAGRPYGIEAVMRDNSGNWMVLVEHRPFTPKPGHSGQLAEVGDGLVVPSM